MEYTRNDHVVVIGTADGRKFTAVYSLEWGHGKREKAIASVHMSVPRWACVDGDWDLYEMSSNGDNPLSVVPNYVERELVESGNDYAKLASHLAWYAVVLMDKIDDEGPGFLDDLYCEGFSDVFATYESSVEAKS